MGQTCGAAEIADIFTTQLMWIIGIMASAYFIYMTVLLVFNWPSKKDSIGRADLLSGIMGGADREERYEKLLEACVRVHMDASGTKNVFTRTGTLGESDEVYAKYLKLEMERIQKDQAEEQTDSRKVEGENTETMV
jgi:hypothetical protein